MLRNPSIDSPSTGGGSSNCVGMGLGAGLVAGSSSSMLDHVLLGHDPSAWATGPVGSRDGVLVVISACSAATTASTPGGAQSTMGSTTGGVGRSLCLLPSTLPVGSGLGLNPALTELKRFWDLGQLAIVDGVLGTRTQTCRTSHRWRIGWRPSRLVLRIQPGGWGVGWTTTWAAPRSCCAPAAEVDGAAPSPHRPRPTWDRGAVRTTGFRRASNSATNASTPRCERCKQLPARDGRRRWPGQAFVDCDLAANLAPLYPALSFRPTNQQRNEGRGTV